MNQDERSHSVVFPDMVVCSLNNFCDYSCDHCYYLAFSQLPEYQVEAMNPEMFDKITKEMANYPESVLRLIAWGEPLLHPNFRELFSLAKINSPSNFKSLITNGYWLNRELAIFLMSEGLNLVEVSLDAYDAASYQLVRSSPYENAFEKVKNNIFDMIQARDDGNFKTKIALSFIVYNTPESEAEFKKFESFWKDKVDEVIPRPAHTFMGSTTKVRLLPESRPPCYCLWARCNISPAGKISVCYNDWHNQNILGDLEEENTTISSVWQSETLNELRAGQLAGCFKGICENCKDYNPYAWQKPYENIIDRSKNS